MKIATISIWTVLALALLNSCDRSCKVISLKYENGKEKEVRTYKECDDTTFYKIESYYERGQIRGEGYIRNGDRDGHFKSWYENGQLETEWDAVNDKEHGEFKCWHENGQLKRTGTQDNEVPVGRIKEWNSNGDLVLDGEFKKGSRQGKWFFREEYGTRKIRTYENGKLEGYSWEHLVDSTGNVTIAVGQFEKNARTGLWKLFDKDSVLFETRELVNGVLNGVSMTYHLNGQIKSKGLLSNGKFEGIVEYFDESGRRTETERYVNGEVVK